MREIRAMPNAQYVGWTAYFNIEAERREKAAEKASRKRRRK